LLLGNGFKTDQSGQIVIQIKTTESELFDALKAIEKKSNKINPLELAMSSNNKMFEKHDIFLSEELLSMDYEKKYLDLQGAMSLIRFITEGKKPQQYNLSSCI